MAGACCFLGCGGGEADENGVTSLQFVADRMFTDYMARRLDSMFSDHTAQQLADDEAALYAVMDCSVDGLEEWPDIEHDDTGAAAVGKHCHCEGCGTAIESRAAGAGLWQNVMADCFLTSFAANCATLEHHEIEAVPPDCEAGGACITEHTMEINGTDLETSGGEICRACTDIVACEPLLPSSPEADFTDEFNMIDVDDGAYVHDCDGGNDFLLRATTMIQGWDDLEYETSVDDGVRITDMTQMVAGALAYDSDRHGWDSCGGDGAQADPSTSGIFSPVCSTLQKRLTSSGDVKLGDIGASSLAFSPPSPCHGNEQAASSDDSGDEMSSGSPITTPPHGKLFQRKLEKWGTPKNHLSSKHDAGIAKGKHHASISSPVSKHGKGVAAAHKGKTGHKKPKSYSSDSDDPAGPSKSGSPMKWDPLKCGGSSRKKGSSAATETWKDLMSKSGAGSDKDRQKVVQALYTFEELRQNFIELEGVRAAKGRAEGLRCTERPDLRASSQMKVDGLRVNTAQCIGNVPGIQVGDHFWYRIEMVVVGLHQQLEAGIAYIGKGNSPLGVSLATSIVMKHSGNPYQDDAENGELITYTGQGGLSHRSIGATSVTNQVLTRGNEALKNSCQHNKPIRVIRGTKDKASPTGESYTYIGLYQVMAMRYETGVQGMLVYKFNLRRLPGQPRLQPVAAATDPSRSPPVKGKGSWAGQDSGKRAWEPSSLKVKGSAMDGNGKGKRMKSFKGCPVSDDGSSCLELSSPPKWAKGESGSGKGKKEKKYYTESADPAPPPPLLKGKKSSAPLLLEYGEHCGGGSSAPPLALTWKSERSSNDDEYDDLEAMIREADNDTPPSLWLACTK